MKSARIAHIMDGAQQSKLGGNESYVNGVYIPNDMQAASIYFANGLYESRVTSTVAADGGQLKVGLISNSMDNYYWKLKYNSKSSENKSRMESSSIRGMSRKS